MATISAFPSMHSICFPRRTISSSPSLTFGNVRLQSLVVHSSNLKLLAVNEQRSSNRRLRVVKAVEEEIQVPGQQEEASTSEQQPVVVPILPSGTFTLYFQVQ